MTEPAPVIADLAARRAKAEAQGDGVRFEAPPSGKGAPRLVLPRTPDALDTSAQARWLTAVFNLDPARPIVSGQRHGKRGPAGHIVLHRHNGQEVRFEPASRTNTGSRLREDLNGYKLPGDGTTYVYRDEHAQQITDVLRDFCAVTELESERDETAGIVGVFLQNAEPVEGHGTYGASTGRYEAAVALQRAQDERGQPCVAPRVLIDCDTGELVIRVQDLNEVARKQIGSSLARGWLDARMADLGWSRVRLDGHGLAGRVRQGNPHARVDVFRGHLPATEETS